MSEITFPYAPGFADVPDSVLEAENFAMGVHIGRINENVAMGMVRPEVFIQIYSNGETVALPVSTVDGYKYSRNELNYMWGINGLADRKTGVNSYQNLSWWFGQWFVDQDTGLVTCEKYYSNDSGSKTQKSNDGVLVVYTIATRRKTTMSMSQMPWFVAHDDTDYATDKALHTTPLTDMSRNAKFSIVASEAIYMGTYKSTEQVALPVSPVDGYEYSESEVTWLWSWVWTTDGDAYVPPTHTNSQMHQMRAHVDADGTVHVNIHYYNSHDIDMGDTNGRIAVLALCQRNGGQRQRFVVDVELEKNFTSVFGYYTAAINLGRLQLHTPLPPGAVITAVYPCMTALATGEGNLRYVAGQNLGTPVREGVYGGGTLIGIGDGTPAHGSDILGSLTDLNELLDEWSFAVAVVSSLPPDYGGIFVGFFTTPGNVHVTECGYAIYYTHSSPTTDTIMTPPVTVTAGHGVAWAIPTRTDAGDTLLDTGTYWHRGTITRGTLDTGDIPMALPGGGAWAWVDSIDLAAGKPLRTDLFTQINDNLAISVLRPEFFDAGDFTNGGNVALPVSPIDGYTYTRDECMYLWEMKDTGLNLSSMIRILTWNAWVDQTTGNVTINMCHFKDGGHVAWDNEGTLCVKIIAVRSAAHDVPDNSGGSTSTAGDDVPSDPIASTTSPGSVIVDGTTIVVNPVTGVISATTPITTQGDLIVGDATNKPSRLPATADTGQVLTNNGAGQIPSYKPIVSSIIFCVDGGASTPATPISRFVKIPFNCVIVGWSVMADRVGTAQFDILKASSLAGIGSTASIVAAAPPILSAAQSVDSTTMTGWTVNLSAGQLLELKLVGISTILSATLELTVYRT